MRKDREADRAYHKMWREKNREHVRKKGREAAKRYRESEGGAAVLAAGRDKRIERSREWFEKNRDKAYAASAKWAKAHPEYRRAAALRHIAKVRDEVFDHYGSECVCCGESERAFLTIDHITPAAKTGGRETRGGSPFYQWLKKNGFPKENFRVLCFNCNCGRRHGPCPHEVSRSRAAMRNVNEVTCNVRIG